MIKAFSSLAVRGVKLLTSILGGALALALVATVNAQNDQGSPYARWRHGPPVEPDFFPIGVSTQDPADAADFKDIGVNLYLRLWDGPTEQQLQQLQRVGMRTICNQNAVGLRNLDNKLIIGWTQPDEPDNAQHMQRYWNNDRERIRRAWPEMSDQQIAALTSYGPPIPWSEIVSQAGRFRQADPTRPVRLNLSMGVAYVGWHGRGTRTGKLEDYLKYIRNSDIISFDIYPYNETKPELKGKLWRQAVGLNRLKNWTRGQKPIWNYIETTKIYPNGRRPPKEVIRSEVWMSIIYGSRGIVYFCHGYHQDNPGEFWSRALLHDKEQMKNLAEINEEILSLAPVINERNVVDGVVVTSSTPPSEELARHDLPAIALLAKQHKGSLYIFSARMEDTPATGTFALSETNDARIVEVLGENRTLTIRNGSFVDDFPGYGVHLYRIPVPRISTDRR